MKNLFALLLFIPFWANAQDWQMVNSQRVALFGFNDNLEYKSVKIDSVAVSGSDSVFYFENGWNNFIFDTLCLPNYESWLGYSVAVNDTQTIFSNRYIDSIVFWHNAPLDSEWVVVQNNTLIIKARVLGITDSVIFGITDSVKVIELLTFDADLQPYNHKFNHYKVRISKNLGMLKIPDIQNFPNDTTTYTLQGIEKNSLGVQNLTVGEIYDFKAGDVFHKIESAQHLGKQYENFILDSVTNIYTNQDSLYIEYFRVSKKIYYVSPNIIEEKSYTYTSKISLIDNKIDFRPYSGHLVTEGYTKHVTSNQLKSSDFGMKKIVKVLEGSMTSDSCFKSTMDWNPGLNARFYKGAGGPYECYGMFTIYCNDLVYYKKSTGEWGNPIDFKTIGIADELKNKITIYPNPAQNTIVFEAQFTSNYYVDIYDSFGKKIASDNFANSLQLNLENYPSGVYYYQIYTNREKTAGKFVKL